MKVTAYTDGACSGNPGPGGWGFLLIYGVHRLEASDKLELTTSNQAELVAVREAVRVLKKPCELTVVTDSQNVIGWLSLGWKRKDAAIRQRCLEIEAIAVKKGVILSFEKVKGYAGTPENERLDQLATRAIYASQRRARQSAQARGRRSSWVNSPVSRFARAHPFPPGPASARATPSPTPT